MFMEYFHEIVASVELPTYSMRLARGWELILRLHLTKKHTQVKRGGDFSHDKT